jgi:RNA polymerase sigma-54 factor
MNLELRPGMRLGLEQRLTPQLILLMKLLVRPCLELRSEIAAALTDNPALEEIPDADAPLPESEQIAAADDLRFLEHLDGGAGGDLLRVGLERETRENDDDVLDRIAPCSMGLEEHLLQQLREEILDERARSIGEWIIRNLDANGYLNEEVPAIAARLVVAPEDVATVLSRVQAFHPVGVSARDARECLLIQARLRFPERPKLARLIEDCLPDLTKRRYSLVARALGVTIDEVREEERRLLCLNPRPSRGFGDGATSYVMPDVRILRVDGRLLVRVNDDGLPRLRVNPQFRQILRNARGVPPEELAFARAKVTGAKWFIRGIYERQRTIRRVTEAIVQRQRDFFELGPQYLRPMILTDVANDVGLSGSTVSRVTSGKYADTPLGLFELKYFFGVGISGAGGVDIAPTAAKEMIRNIVAREDSTRPFSDQNIQARLVADYGVKIARRTVAKYRETLGIGCSNQRRHEKTLARRSGGPS